MVTGRRAFPGVTTAIVHDAILNRAPDPPSRIDSRVPPELERIIMRALQKSRSARYPNATQMRLELKRLKQRLDSGHISESGGIARRVRSAELAYPPAIPLSSESRKSGAMTVDDTRRARGATVVSYSKTRIAVSSGPNTGLSLDFAASSVRVGTAPDNEIVLSDDSVSRHHCEIA